MEMYKSINVAYCDIDSLFLGIQLLKGKKLISMNHTSTVLGHFKQPNFLLDDVDEEFSAKYNQSLHLGYMDYPFVC
jgi:hypothetical protein